MKRRGSQLALGLALAVLGVQNGGHHVAQAATLPIAAIELRPSEQP